jgi:creatinine amidohydrolase
MSGPLHLKTLLPDDVRLALERDPRLLVPVGTCESHGPHLPLGCDTLIVERLADDLSADYQILRAPTVEYGVNSLRRRQFSGSAAVRRKTLHRWMNDLIGSWEEAGVDAFVILTAHGYDPHQEALSTLRTRRARILTVDVFALDFTGRLDDPDGPLHGSELDTSLLLYVAPQLVDLALAQNFLPARQSGRFGARRDEHGASAAGGPRAATREKGEQLYKMIYERIATRVLESAVSAA